MSQARDKINVRTLQAEAERVFPLWAADHAEDDMISVIASNGSQYQDIGKARFEALPNLEAAQAIGTIGLGGAFEELVNDFRSMGIVDLAWNRAAEGSRTLISNVHLDNIMDAPATHAALFVASENEEFAHRNVLLVNPMLGWTAIKGFDTMPVLVRSGVVVSGIPLDGAVRHGLSTELLKYHGQKAAKEFFWLKNNGHTMHRAPTATRAKNIRLADGVTARSVPRLSDKEARRLRRNYEEVVGVAMDVQKSGSVAQVLKPRHIAEDRDVHIHMEEMAETIGILRGENVVYGMPKGAEPIEV